MQTASLIISACAWRRTEELDDSRRNCNGGEVMVLPWQVHPPCIGQRAGDGCHRIFQGCRTLLSAHDEGWDLARSASVAQDRPVLHQRKVVRQSVGDTLVLLPCTPHDQRHNRDE